MDIINLQAQDKVGAVSDILLNSTEQGKTVLIIFNSIKELIKVFRLLRNDCRFSNFKFREYRREISNGSYVAYFMLANRDNLQGLRCDIAIVFDDLEEDMKLFISTKIRGANNFEKTMYVVKELDSTR